MPNAESVNVIHRIILDDEPLADGQRGLIVSPPSRINEEGALHLSSTNLDAMLLRHGLLLWDVIQYPDNNILSTSDYDEDLLISCGAMRRSKVVFSRSVGTSFYAEAQIATFRALDDRDKGKWCVARGENCFTFPEDERQLGRGGLLRLYNCIPVPQAQVSLHEILEFRERRRPELMALRHHIEGVYLEAIGSRDQALGLSRAVSAMDIAIADHIKSARESRIGWKWGGIDLAFNFAPVAVGALSAALLGLPLAEALMAGGAAGVTVSAGAGLKSGASAVSPFEYITRFNSESSLR